MAGEDRYRLATVRDLRARDERARKGDLAVAVGDAREWQVRLDAARTRTRAARSAVDAARAARDGLLAAGAASTVLVRAEAFIARRLREHEAATAEELRCEAALAGQLGEVDTRRRTLARARADREIIERHFERWRESRRKLAERRED